MEKQNKLLEKYLSKNKKNVKTEKSGDLPVQKINERFDKIFRERKMSTESKRSQE